MRRSGIPVDRIVVIVDGVIAAELFLSPHTIRSQMKSIYRKLGSTHAIRRSPGPVRRGFWKGEARVPPIGGMAFAPARGGLVPDGERDPMDQV